MSESSTSDLSEHFKAFKEWVSTIREDIEAVEAIVSCKTINREARICAAAALNYLVARMDLVPDWEESVGVLDDVMVMRICVDLASQYGLDEGLEDPDHIVAVGRMSNDLQRIEDFLGPELNADLRKHCARLSDTAVRGRGCGTIVESPEEQQKLFAEVEADLKRMPPAPFTDPKALAVKFKSYLAYKLKN